MHTETVTAIDRLITACEWLDTNSTVKGSLKVSDGFYLRYENKSDRLYLADLLETYVRQMDHRITCMMPYTYYSELKTVIEGLRK